MRFLNDAPHGWVDFFREDSGAFSVEHILIGTLIAVVLTLVLLALNKD